MSQPGGSFICELHVYFRSAFDLHFNKVIRQPSISTSETECFKIFVYTQPNKSKPMDSFQKQFLAFGI